MSALAFDANLLFSLHALLQEQSVTKAAKRLGVSQPAMSHSLAKLRKQLQDPLLVRVGLRMERTERADKLVSEVATTIADFQKIFQPASAFEPSEIDRLFSIAACDEVQFSLLPKISSQLSKDAPDARLKIVDANKWSISDMLREGEVDLAIGSFRRPRTSFSWKVLFEESLVGIARKDHPLISPNMELEALSKLSHILISSKSFAGHHVDDFLDEEGIERNIVMTLPSLMMAPHIVCQTDHVVLLPYRMAQIFLASLPLRSFSIPIPPYTIAMMWHNRTGQDRAWGWMRDLLLEHCETLISLPEAFPSQIQNQDFSESVKVSIAS